MTKEKIRKVEVTQRITEKGMLKVIGKHGKNVRSWLETGLEDIREMILCKIVEGE